MDNQIIKRIIEIRTNWLLKYSLIVIMIAVFLLPKTVLASSITPGMLVTLTNQEREKSGLNDLNVNPLLSDAAEAKAKAILSSDTFAHTIEGRTFSGWIKDTGYQYSFVGENLAMDFETSEGIMGGWMASPLHKKNILNPRFQEIGIAAVTGNFQNQETTVVAEIFGTPLVPINTPVISPKPTPTQVFNNYLDATGSKIDNTAYVLATNAGWIGGDIRSNSFMTMEKIKNYPVKNKLNNFFSSNGFILFANTANLIFIIYLAVCVYISSIFFNLTFSRRNHNIAKSGRTDPPIQLIPGICYNIFIIIYYKYYALPSDNFSDNFRISGSSFQVLYTVKQAGPGFQKYHRLFRDALRT